MRCTSALSQLFCALIGVLFLRTQSDAFAQARYSQIVLAFPNERPFNYSYEPKEKTLVLEFKNTSPQELEALYHYDESIVQRAIFKDMAGEATEARLILRDDSIRIMVNSFAEPFRITIDFFDKNYKETTDPTTGLPLAAVDTTMTNQSIMATPEITNQIQPSLSATPHSSKTDSKRKLLQPNPQAINTAQEMIGKLNEVTAGIGQNWKNYPPYIIRIQTANLKSPKNNDAWMRNNAEKALTSAEALARYAGQLFDFGHETKALILYQKLLHEDPSIFEKQAESIWNIAEIHLGQGNLTLAEGYYDSMIEKHSDHPLASYAQLRRLDIKAIRAIKEQTTDIFPELVRNLGKISIKNTPGITSQLALRMAYWDLGKNELQSSLNDFHKIPEIEKQNLARLESNRPQADGPKTAFLMDTIILHNRLALETWTQDLATLTKDYFSRYKGPATEPYRGTIQKESEQNFLKVLTAFSEEKDYENIVKIVENLPPELQGLRNNSAVSWAMAESLRQLKQDSESIAYYENSLKSAKSKIDQFRTLFILSQVTSNALSAETAKNNSRERIEKLRSKFKQADSKAWEAWQELTPQEKGPIYAELKDSIESQVSSINMSKTSPLILLQFWGQKLASDTPSSGTAVNAKDKNAMPTVRMISMLASLANRFEKLGLSSERRKAKHLQSLLNLKSSPVDKESLKVWTNEITQLAEEYREENNFLEAGRLFAQAGSSNNQWEGRAEALYKGGLLLYRAGRREEALSSFQQAASDGSNLLYADLAKQRLEQLK